MPQLPGGRGGMQSPHNLQERLIPHYLPSSPCLSLFYWGKSQHQPSLDPLMEPLEKAGGGGGWCCLGQPS